MAKTKEGETHAVAENGAMEVWTADEKYRSKIGVVFPSKNGGFDLFLNALPFTKKLRIVERKKAEEPKE